MAALPKNSQDIDQIYHVPKNIFPKQKTNIQNFYSKKNILITGASGFLGKLLLEKLLWSCPDIGNIYIMLRQKKGKDSFSRIDDLIDTPAFSRLKKDQPLFKDKIKVINGDCEVSGLGLSPDDREEIIEEVNIIFHVAASVRFHEPLTTALNINLRATQDLIELAKEVKDLEVFMHVSTAYCQCYLPTLDERFYETPMDPIKLLKFLESSDKKIIDDISPKLLGKWPNTYTFSKALTEDYIRQSAVGMPIGIFRPSIIISSVNEPVPRWVDNWYGVSGFITACSVGLLRVMSGKADAEANIVPVDMCVNAMIASAWDIHERRKIQKPLEKPTAREIQIYNFVLTGKTITWGKFYNSICQGGVNYPPAKALWYHSLSMCINPIKIFLNKVFLHYVPGILIDAFSVCTGQKPEIIKMYDRIHKMNDVTKFFATKHWNFSNHNMLKVQAKMTEEDRLLYLCDVKKIDWNDYLNGYFLGIRRYLMKDDDSTLVSAKRKYAILYWMNKFVRIILFLSLLRGMYRTGKMMHSRLSLRGSSVTS